MSLDFASQADYFVAYLPEILLCIFGMIVLISGVWRPRTPMDARPPSPALGWTALVGIGLATVATFWLDGVEIVGGSSVVTVDRFRLFGNGLILAAGAFTVLLSFTYVARQRLQVGEYFALLLFSMAGMMFMVGTVELIILFLGLEVMSIAAYALAAFNRRDRRSAEAGLKYFFLGAFATAFLLYGITLVYGATGSTDIREIARAIEGGATGIALHAGIGLLTVGFGFKIAAVPFHMWTPDVYEGAPTPVAAFMATGVKAAGFLAMTRVFMTAFGAIQVEWSGLFWWLAVATMVAANLIALVQSNVKRMLAYSSVAHAGYLLVALVAGNATAMSGMLFYLLVYTIMNIGAFAVLLCVSEHGEERMELDDYAGFGSRHPFLGVVFTLFLLSLAGFPWTAGFVGKLHLLLGLADAELWTLAVILVMTTVASYWYYLRVAWYMWMRDASEEIDGREDPVIYIPATVRTVLVLCAILVILLGVLPGAALDITAGSLPGGEGNPAAFILRGE